VSFWKKKAPVAPLAGEPAKPKKKRKKKKPFELEQCMDIAEASFAMDPKWRGEQEALGEFVASFFVPLDVCPTINTYMNMFYLQRVSLKTKALRIMFEQYGKRRTMPLAGKPVVILVRFSCKQPDQETSWHKIIVDRLLAKHHGLGILVDDNPDAVELRSSWRHAPMGKGFGYVEVWSGGRGLH
jgi:hypothetical protein